MSVPSWPVCLDWPSSLVFWDSPSSLVWLVWLFCLDFLVWPSFLVSLVWPSWSVRPVLSGLFVLYWLVCPTCPVGFVRSFLSGLSALICPIGRVWQSRLVCLVCPSCPVWSGHPGWSGMACLAWLVCPVQGIACAPRRLVGAPCGAVCIPDAWVRNGRSKYTITRI